MSGKTILVLTGSPRKGGNSDMMADAFIEGAKRAGHSILRFDAGRELVNGCRGCGACWAKGKACVFDDGFAKLAEMAVQADVLVLASPIYWFSFTSQIKAAIDKFNSFLKPACKTPLKLKECALLACAHDSDPDVFDGMKETYRLMARYLKLTDRGIVTVQHVSDKGDVAGTDAIERAERFGASI